MLPSGVVRMYAEYESRIVGKSAEEQLAEWMIDNDIDANRVMDYIRECEETVITTTE